MYYSPSTLTNACLGVRARQNYSEKYSFSNFLQSRFLNYQKITNFALQSPFSRLFQGCVMNRQFLSTRLCIVCLALACVLLFGAENIFGQQYYQYPTYSSQQRSYRQSATPYYSSPYYTDEGTNYDTPQTSTSELGLRYLKLSNSYREAQNTDMAQYYARRGYDLVRGRGSRYWEAVANEYLGLIYRDMGDNGSALEYLRRAESIYRSVMSPLRGESSVDAIQKVISDVEYGYRYIYPPKAVQNYRWYSDYPFYSRPLSSRYSSSVTLEKERLQRTNMLLQARLNDLEARLRSIEQPVYYGR